MPGSRPRAALLAAIPCALAAHAFASGSAGALDRKELALVRWVDAHGAEAEALLERAVNVNSGTLNLAGVREAGVLFRKELDALGLETRWEDGAAFERAGHLIASSTGQKAGRRHVLLVGHLDTVFERDSPFQRFERLSATSARGPGIIDMKGGIVVMIHALRALRFAGLLDRLAITIVLTGDEEKPGRPLELARRSLVAAARQADVAIGFEDAAGDPRTAVVARRGSSTWELRSTGAGGHSSQLFKPGVGAGAVYEAARALDAFRQRLSDEPYLTFNPGLVLGGTTIDHQRKDARGEASGKENLIAAQAVVTGDLRSLTPEQLERARTTMREIAAASLPHTSSAITFDDGYPPMAPSQGNRALLALYDRASRDLGLGPVEALDPARAGAADISFTATHVAMALDGAGLMGSNDHSPAETADLATLPTQTKRMAVLLYRLGAAGR